jgi:sulfate transport system ATP-binding protein
LGPSGSGKTTLLRILAGLDFPDGGDIVIDGQPVLGHSPRDRQVGFVFQHYSLFRHMTVFGNIAFGLQVRRGPGRLGAADIARRVDDLLGLVQLDHLADRYPAQLSGGQRQRVALARALAIEPKVLLLDEPFGALDAKVRKDLRRWLRRLHEDMPITSVFVTHDQEEALEVADRVVVMSQGRIEQIGSPDDVYDHPASPFVFDFLGNVNRLDCVIDQGLIRLPGLAPLAPAPAAALEGPVIAFIRPHDIDIVPAAEGPGLIRLVHAVGPQVRIEIDLAGQTLEATMDRERLRDLRLTPGDRCALTLPVVRVFPGQ